MNVINIIKEELQDLSERIGWDGKWIPDESPFEKASEYSLLQDLTKELQEITSKYQGRIKDETIAEALNSIIRKYQR